METTFISILENAIYISGNINSKLYSYSDYNIESIDNETVGRFAVTALQDFYDENNINSDGNNKVIVLASEAYMESDVTCEERTKENDENNYELSSRRFNINTLLKNFGQQDTPVISEIKETYYKNQKITNSAQVPLYSKYYVKTIKSSFNSTFLKKVTYYLLKEDFKIEGIFPLNLLSNYNHSFLSCNKFAYLSFCSDSVSISLMDDKIVKKQVSLSLGYNKIIQKVSDHFNLSISISKKLVSKYGFVFLPKRYTDFVIDIPVFKDMEKSVELPELSFIIREQVKIIIDKLINTLQVDSSGLCYYNNLLLNSDMPVSGMDKLVSMAMGLNVEQFDLSYLSHRNLSACVHKLCEDKIKNQKEPETAKLEKKIISTTEKDRQVNIIEKFKYFFNTQVKDVLMEP